MWLTIRSSAGDFHTLSDEIIAGYLPPDLAVTRAYLPGSYPAGGVEPTTQQIADTRKIILDWLQAGGWLAQYSGHGAIDLWATDLLLTIADVPSLANDARLPVVMGFSCLDGYFIHLSDEQSLAETLQRRQGGGAVATISPSGLGLTIDQQNFRQILMTVLFKDGVRDLGTALTKTKQAIL